MRPFFVQRTTRSKSTTGIFVIAGSTREGRFPDKPAKWIFEHLERRRGVDTRLLDLRDFPMPFFDQPMTPATPGRPPYKNEFVQKWTAAAAESDGFIFITPEGARFARGFVAEGANVVISNVIEQGGTDARRRVRRSRHLFTP